MERCPRCSTVVEADWAYCPLCNRPRILESLRAPAVWRAWQHQVWQGLVAFVALWLVVTVGVAFLREAKAVRDGRRLLAEGNAQGAWSRIGPFLTAHPEHRQALFLCGKATIRLGSKLRSEAKQCLDRLGELSPELAEELRADYGQVLTEQARALSCDLTAFADLLAWGEELGDDHAGSVITGLDGVIETCRTSENDYIPARIAGMLTEKGQAMAMVEGGYVPAIGRAVAQARYLDAEALARQAVRLVPDGAAAVEAALAGERQKVAATVATLTRLRDDLQADSRHRAGNSWCFPAAIPPVVQSARDGWGNAVLYSPLGADDAERCHQGFALTSYGGDGQETEDDWRRSPAAEIVSRFVAGRESRQVPNGFWWETE